MASLAQIAGSGVSFRKDPVPSARRTWKVREVPPRVTASTISRSHRAAGSPDLFCGVPESSPDSFPGVPEGSPNLL
ncbi:hypothetical protein SAMN05216275_103148 [Streptosporangium canum]|uniref:Uncharacterized protein n=1 Tax=Streptosporangium canum TaxID=324952 RepID=A0A1I3I5M4_9ACTN|nr:hypothetical protein SAMN05216275_103148 [Streptosporangium canum]